MLYIAFKCVHQFVISHFLHLRISLLPTMQCIRALMSARGIKETDEVDSEFIDVMRDEGYIVPDLAEFEEVA